MLARNYVQADEPMAVAVMRWLRENVTEEVTDGWADRFAEAIPAKVGIVPLPRFIVRAVVDRILPEQLLDILEAVLRRAKLLPEFNERRAHPRNPFNRNPLT